MAQISCEGETIVDLYAGIGYYTIPLLVKARAAKVSLFFRKTDSFSKVVACEWNRPASEALKINAKANGVFHKCCILEGDCRKCAPKDVADRVLLGLLPSSRGGWKTALASLKPEGETKRD